MKITDKEYFENKALSISLMKEALKSPKHFWEALENEKEPTKAMEIGTMIHMAILEQVRFLEEYVPDPGLDKRTKEYKEWLKTNENKKTYDALFLNNILQELDKATNRYESLKLIREEKTINEEALFCGYKDLDLKCKIDAYSPDENMLIDIKTTNEIEPTKFQKVIFERAYHIQMAHYKRCLEENNIHIDKVKILAISTQPPFDVIEFDFGPDVMQRATEELYALYETVSFIKTFNIRVGYCEKSVDVQYPAYYRNYIY